MCGYACDMYNILWVCVYVCVCMLSCSIHVSHVGPSCPLGSLRHGYGGAYAQVLPCLPRESPSKATAGRPWETGMCCCLGSLEQSCCPAPSLRCPPCDLGAPAVMLQFYPKRRSPTCKRPQAPRPARPACLPAGRESRVLAMFSLININPFNHCFWLPQIDDI